MSQGSRHRTTFIRHKDNRVMGVKVVFCWQKPEPEGPLVLSPATEALFDQVTALLIKCLQAGDRREEG
ncbi:MAG: hypothetical protein PHC60_02030 [Heliobacteriaceae bacterium]|nr:hypothetical protein [Heliobacteriaceae bacterium]MDD4587157.1 hypothetical protein [Heliobacteriaceae bacterium]